jgi:hypothetical protein
VAELALLAGGWRLLTIEIDSGELGSGGKGVVRCTAAAVCFCRLHIWGDRATQFVNAAQALASPGGTQEETQTGRREASTPARRSEQGMVPGTGYNTADVFLKCGVP